MQRTLAGAGTALLLAVGSVLGVASSALAAGGLLIDVPGDGEGFVDGTSTPLLDFDDLEPGDVRSAEVDIWNDYSGPVALRLQAVDVVEHENGCPEPETNEGGDATCGPEEGELGPWLDLTVTRTDTPADEVLWTGNFTELSSPVLLADPMPADAVWGLRVTVEMPVEAGNETMTDEVEFDLAWSTTGDRTPGEPEQPGQPEQPEQPGEPSVPGGPGGPGGQGGPGNPGEAGGADVLGVAEIAGVEASRPAGLGGSGVTLPFTGVTVDAWLVWFAGVLIVGGSGLVLGSRLPRGALAPRHARS